MDKFLKGGASRAPAPSEEINAKRKQLPWIEKFRPKTLDKIVSHQEIIVVLRRFIQNGELPHLLFYGPPGTGKTLTILALAKEIFGSQYSTRVKELNASDERGISVIREKVKQFARGAATANTDPQSGRRIPSFKLVVLDEADTMTEAAQAALRRMMEREARSTRFCLLCNYVSRIIPPIASRCAKFRFKPLDRESTQSMLREIASAEHLSPTDDSTLDALVESAEGDLRRAITLLQSLRSYHSDEKIGRAHVLEMAGFVPDAELEALVLACRSNSYETLEQAVSNLFAGGYSGRQVLQQLHDRLLAAEAPSAVAADEEMRLSSSLRLSDTQKAAIVERIAAADRALLDGASEFLQLLAVCFTLMNLIQNA